MVEIDPYVTCLREIYSSSSNGYLIERLHKEVDRMDTVSHILALRQLARSRGPIQAFTEAIHGCYTRREYKTIENKDPKGSESKESRAFETRDAKAVEIRNAKETGGKASAGSESKETKGGGGNLTLMKESVVELPLSVFVRAEAALMLAKCNNLAIRECF